MGRPAIKALNLISRVNFVDSSERFVNLYPDLFTGLGALSAEYHIQLKHDLKPYPLTTPRRVAIPLMPKVKQNGKHGCNHQSRQPYRLVCGYGYRA